MSDDPLVQQAWHRRNGDSAIPRGQMEVTGDVTVVGGLTDDELRATAVPVSVSGVATATNQTTQITGVGSLTESAPGTDTASSGLNGRLQRIAQRLTSLIALLPSSLGQKAKAASLAVTLASDQDALPITDNGGSLTVDGTVAVTGTFWQATQPVSAASLPLPTGASTETTLGTRLSESDFDTKVGSLTESAPATDTASSGVNGRLQRIAQRLSSAITLLGGGLPAALGAQGALKVEGVASGTAQPVSGTVTVTNPTAPATGSTSTVAASATAVTVLASNGSRRGAVIVNESTSLVYLKYGSSASATDYTVMLLPGTTVIGYATHELTPLRDGCYTGIISGIWASATGNARVTEIT